MFGEGGSTQNKLKYFKAMSTKIIHLMQLLNAVRKITSTWKVIQ